MDRLRVLLTVDTEFWPSRPDFTARLTRDLLRPEEEFRRDILGETPRGAFGVPFQLELLGAHGLRGVYFVEALAASVVGPETLRRTVELIQGAGQEVALHLHTEWLRVEPNRILPGRRGANIRDFTLEEQRALLGRAKANLIAAGAKTPTAYRAGNFGANWDTLRALRDLDIRFDSSYNASLLGRACDMPGPVAHLHAFQRDGLWEIPVSCYEDRPGRLRHVQVGACSFPELVHALDQAWRRGWRHFVVVSHSNELLSHRRDGPNRIVVDRFRRLCEHLAAHRDRFETIWFSQIEVAGVRESDEGPGPFRSDLWLTAWRVGEQLVQRWI
jgi:hypothetical protein